MKLTIVSLSLIFLLSSFFVSDIATYDQIPNQSYFPIVKGQSRIYQRDLNTYTMTFDSSETKFRGRKYVKQISNFGSSIAIAYYREHKGNTFYLKESDNKETLAIPSNPFKGMEWNAGDLTWKLTITSMSEELITPNAKFLNCMVIKYENINRINPQHFNIYLQYFQRGRGYVGTKVGGILYSYLENVN